MLNLLSKRREHFVLALVWLIFWSLILVSVGSRINQHGLIRTIAGKTSTSRVQVWPWTFVDEADFDTRDFAHVVNHVNLEGVVWQGQPGQSTWRIIHTGNLRVQIDRQIILDIKERVPLTATDVPVTWERNHFDLEIEFAGGPAVWDYDDPAMQMGIYERTPWGGWRLVSPYRLYPTIPEATLAQREMVASAVLDVARIAWWMGVIVLAVLGIWHSKLWRQPSAWAMAGILPLGLLARYLSLLYQEAHSPFFYYYAAGSDNYVLLARELLAGELGFASTHYYVNPGNIYWLSWWMLLVGLQQRGLVLVNILLAVLSVCVLTVATWKAFGRQAGIFCGLIAAIFPAIIDFQTNLTVASPLISFTMLTVGAGLWISQRPTWQSSVWFGLANGFAVLLRPTSLFVGPAIFMALMVARDSSAPWRGWKRIATLTLTAAFCSFVVTGPQIAANIASGQNIIQSAQMGSNGPITLYIGANQDSSGQIEYFRPAFLRVRHGDANWNKAIAADVVAKPMRTFQLYLHKLGLLWSNLEYSDHPFHIGIDSDNGGRPPQYPWLGMTTLAFLGISGNMATLLEQSTKRSMAAWFLVCCTLLLMLAIATYPVIARYRVPIYPPLCVAAGLAIQRLIETIKQRHLMRSLVISAGLAGTLLLIAASFEHHLPRKDFSIDYASTFAQRNIVFGNQIQLFGSRPIETNYQSGGYLYTTFYWQLLSPTSDDLMVSIQLLDRKGDRVAWADAALGSSSYPEIGTSQWPMDAKLAESYFIKIPDDAPPVMDIYVNLYDPDTGDRLPIIAADGTSTKEDRIHLGRLGVLTAEGVPALEGPVTEADYWLGDSLHITGHSLPQTLSLSDNLSLGIRIEAIRPIDEDYILFFHLLDAAGLPVTQSDSPILNGDWTTASLIPGHPLGAIRSIDLPDDLLPGKYRLVMGMYTYPSLERLPVRDGQNNPLVDNLIEAGWVAVK